MNLRSTRYPNWQSIILTLFALSMLGVACSQTETTAGQVLNTDTPTPYPMDYPPEKQTAEVGVIQTEEAAWLTPEPTDYVTFPDITTTPFLLPTPVGTLAGAGLITTELGSPTSRGAFSISNAWLERTASGDIIVSAGARGTDPSQGVVIVNTRNGVFKDWYETPIKAGELTIIGAEGERLILISTDGTTFYFDVPGRTFVASLAEVVPTATPALTFTPAPTLTPRYSDDAPDDPWQVSQNSSANTDLMYTINPTGDVDWLRFHNDITGTIQADLTNLPANYDLYVYSATDPQLTVSSTNEGLTSEQVIIRDAPVNDYYIRVVGVGGASSATPYTLRFNAPSPVTDTPTPTDTPTATPTSTPITLAFYLHGSGATANPPTLFLNASAPTDTTAKYKDSASVNFNGGNSWKEIGAWMATPVLPAGQLTSLSDLHVWLGLKNSDDIGTRFDLRAEVYRNGVLVTAGESDCITGVARNAEQAKEVVITFAAFAPVNFDGVTDTLSLKILVRVGTDGAGAFCGGHSNAVGARLYFDAVSREANFGTP